MVKRSSRLERLLGKKGSALFLQGVRLFNRQRFWEAHEVFEDVWRLHEGEARTLAQGFVQTAAALSYMEKKRYESILYLVDKSTGKLSTTMHLLRDVDIPALIEAMRKARAEIIRLGATNLDQFNPSLYPRITSTDSKSPSRAHRVQKS